jgi:hypothetical protein
MLDECTFEKGIRCGVPSMLCANCEAAHSGIRISQDEVYKIRSERRKTKDREYRRRADHDADEIGGELHFNSQGERAGPLGS